MDSFLRVGKYGDRISVVAGPRDDSVTLTLTTPDGTLSASIQRECIEDVIDALQEV